MLVVQLLSGVHTGLCSAGAVHSRQCWTGGLRNPKRLGSLYMRLLYLSRVHSQGLRSLHRIAPPIAADARSAQHMPAYASVRQVLSRKMPARAASDRAAFASAMPKVGCEILTMPCHTARVTVAQAHHGQFAGRDWGADFPTGLSL